MDIIIKPPLEVYNIIKKNNLTTLPFCIPIFKDFQYFSPVLIEVDLEDGRASDYFLVLERETIYGVLKLGVCDKDEKVRVIEYVDVHKQHRRKGIATKLYQALNNWGKDKPFIIVGTSLTNDGKQANLYSLRKKILVDVQNFDTYADYVSKKENNVRPEF